MSYTWPDLVVGVDLGTTGTAVAYAKPTENKVRTLTDWPDGETGSRKLYKVPSMVVLQGNNLEAWGFDVIHLDPNSIPSASYYKLFKPQFDSENSSEALKAELCVRTFLGALYQYLQGALQDQLPEGQGWDESKVKFLFSYPTTWDSDTRDRFLDQIKEAGFGAVASHQSVMSLDEADASMMYLFCNTLEKKLPKPSEYVMVADIGGGTSDISLYEMGTLNGRREGSKADLILIEPSQGKYTGSTEIDERFKQSLRPKLKGQLQQYMKEQPDAKPVEETTLDLDECLDATMFNLEHIPAYAKQKHNYGCNVVNGRLQKAEFELSLPVPASLEVQNRNTGAIPSIHLTISKKEFFEKAFDEQCDRIWEQCESLMQKLKSGQTVKHVVLSGGLGSSEYVKESLSARFAKYAKSHQVSPPLIGQIRDAEIAVCQGLVHEELRKIHGHSPWLYPAAASYGLQKGEEKEDIQWFVNEGDKLKAPHSVRIKCYIDIDQISKIGPSDFKIVRAACPTPKKFDKQEEKDRFNQFVITREDIGEWVKESLPVDLKKRFPFSGEAKLIVNAYMSRDLIAMTLHQDKKKPSRTHFVKESWHRIPEANNKKTDRPTTKAWNFNLSLTEKIALAGVVVATVSAAATMFGAVNKLISKREPTDHGVGNGEPGEKGHDNADSPFADISQT